MFKKLANCTAEQLFRLRILLVAVYYLLGMIFLVLFEIHASQNQYSRVFFYLSIFIIVNIIGVKVLQEFAKLKKFIMGEKMDIRTYKDYIQKQLPFPYPNREHFRSVAQLEVAGVEILQGNFEHSLNILKQFNLMKIVPSQRATQNLKQSYILSLNQLYLETMSPEVDIYQKMMQIPLKKKRDRATREFMIAELIALQKLLIFKNPDSYFEEREHFSSTLDKLRNDYHIFLALHMAGEEEKAKAVAKELATKNPDFFFVREAKEYLESGRLLKYKSGASVVKENPDSPLDYSWMLPYKKRRFKKRYLALILVFFIPYIILFSRTDPDINGIYYLQVKHPSTKTVSLDKSDRIVIEEKKARYYKDGEELEAVLNEKDKTLILDGQEYGYTYAFGELSLFKPETRVKDLIEYASDTSPLYEGYEKGTVTYGD